MLPVCLQTLLKDGRVAVTYDNNDTVGLVGSFRNASCLSTALRILPLVGYDPKGITLSLVDNDNLQAAITSSVSSYAYLDTCTASSVSVSCGFATSGLDTSTTYHLLARYPSNALEVSVFLFAPYISGEEAC